MIKKCVICHQEFECKKSTAKYCSRSCQSYAREKRQREQKTLEQVDKYCLICGQPFRPKNKAANQRMCCYDCMPDGVQLNRSGFIDLLRKHRGGCCQRCGYNTYLGALDFHHINPAEKDFTVGNRDFKLKECIEESKKCILICSNCHRELHAGIWDIAELNLEEREEVNS